MSASKVVVDTRGWNIHTHGANGYSRGCRCAECRSGRAEYVRSRRADAAARRIAAKAGGQVYVAAGISHGTASGYKNASCRCLACCQAAKDHRRGVYVSPLAEQPPAVLTCIRCKGIESAGLCCSSHNAALCHRCYRRTHFVERCATGCESCAQEGLDPMKWPEPAANTDQAGRP